MTARHHDTHGPYGPEITAPNGGQAGTPTTPRAAVLPCVPPTTADADLLWRGAALVAEWIERNPESRLSVDEAIELVLRVVTEWPLHRLLSDGSTR